MLHPLKVDYLYLQPFPINKTISLLALSNIFEYLSIIYFKQFTLFC